MVKNVEQPRPMGEAPTDGSKFLAWGKDYPYQGWQMINLRTEPNNGDEFRWWVIREEHYASDDAFVGWLPLPPKPSRPR